MVARTSGSLNLLQNANKSAMVVAVINRFCFFRGMIIMILFYKLHDWMTTCTTVLATAFRFAVAVTQANSAWCQIVTCTSMFPSIELVGPHRLFGSMLYAHVISNFGQHKLCVRLKLFGACACVLLFLLLHSSMTKLVPFVTEYIFGSISTFPLNWLSILLNLLLLPN